MHEEICSYFTIRRHALYSRSDDTAYAAKNESFEEELSKGSVRLKIKHIFMRLLLFAANLCGSKRHRAADSKVSCVAAHPVIS